ncbi:MAG TPA: GGDEF domain-containing protein [Devosia sp.]|nr:GGDEF domain-containing protein [Devosia sp.]
MLDKLRAIDAAGALAAYDDGNSSDVPAIHDIVSVNGRPAFVDVSAIMSESGDDDLKIAPGSENLLVGVRFLDNVLAKVLTEQYLIDRPAFALQPSGDANLAEYRLRNEAGDTVGWLSWVPDRPGAQILRETLPAMLGALAIAALTILLLVRGLYRTTAALEAGRAEAEYNANHDPLTGLANRAFFAHRLEEALSGSGDKADIALLALDLDRFKQVNDTLGHEAGDQLLREVGQRLTPLVTEADTVARLGGDEFAIIRRNVTAPGEVSALSQRIIAALGAPFVLSGRVAQIGVSIGAVITPAARAMRDLSAKADIALYEAKASGRNTYRLFDEEMARAAQFRDRVAGELADAGLPVTPGKAA